MGRGAAKPGERQGGGMTRPPCHQCGEQTLLRRQITASGISQVAWYCKACHDWADKPVHWVGHEAVTAILAPYGAIIETLDIIHDYRDPAYACAVCGELGAEYHHWMPQALARRYEDVWVDWAHWSSLTVYLCPRHHHLWHLRVTPELTP